MAIFIQEYASFFFPKICLSHLAFKTPHLNPLILQIDKLIIKNEDSLSQQKHDGNERLELNALENKANKKRICHEGV